MQQHATSLPFVDYMNPVVVRPTLQVDSQLSYCSDLAPERTTYARHVWTDSRRIEPRRYDDDLIIVNDSLYRENDTGSTRWMLSHYVSLRDRPLTGRRTIVHMRNPLMENHDFPLVALSANYFCWVEMGKQSSKTVGKVMFYYGPSLKVHIAAFPRISLDSDDREILSTSEGTAKDGNEECNIKTLFITARVLQSERLRRIFILEERASILIWTMSHKIFCFEYA